MSDLQRHRPGQTPLADISGLKCKGVTTREQLNAVEFANTAKAIEKYLARRPTRRTAPFDRRWMIRLHVEMFGDVWKWAGELRKRDLNIGVPWHRVEADLESLAGDLEYWHRDKQGDLLEQSVSLHHRAVHIHPFTDGNGRWARLLANVWLKQHKGAIVVWPEAELWQEASGIRGAYIAAVKAADEHDLGPLTALHREYSEKQP